ncbi:L-threonylcarbamoyladenylate synthase [Luteimonas kalidii]|uniref:Threonylcarbamoyl-AMP synthase n=1 Tax=Luteimonas kalidii TaxID=3042025 RepID=A0ABT6JU96_9GAMM|nr:Sua5/YciO/YrdC/YwlC family protein [Luteimonas kalidii]MDH5834265.1 Sua5/YciO/YrdC/YwlC family protein [Luteimonas kalidii]
MHVVTPAAIDQAVAVLRGGGVIAYPTEGVWGLGCDPFDETAVLRLLALKQRTVDKGLILVAATAAQFDTLVDWAGLDDAQRDAVLASWPGPHTWIVPVTARVPRWIRGDHDGVAVRVSSHRGVADLCAGFGGPLVSTSANVAGDPAPTTRAGLGPVISAGVDLVVAGETDGRGTASTLRDARTGRQLR